MKRKLNPFGILFRKIRIDYNIHVDEIVSYVKLSKVYIYRVETTYIDKLSYSYFLKILNFLKDRGILTDELNKQFIISYYKTKQNIKLPTENMDDNFIYELHNRFIKDQ